LRTSRPGRELRQHYRLQTLRAVDHEAALMALLRRLRGVGVIPLLIKGWSSAVLYPEQALRPCSDIDLCVDEEQFETAATALAQAPLPWPVDLHTGVEELPDRTWDELLRRSRRLAVGDEEVQTLGPEDQLRLLCLHQARHGMARPLWLCDVAACLEALPAAFDWDYWLWGAKHLSQWACCVAGLACRLLGACPVSLPLPGTRRDPGWVEEAVSWSWGGGSERPLRDVLHHPGEVLRRFQYCGLSKHPGVMAVRAALQLGIGPEHRLPLLLTHLAAFARKKGPSLLRRLVTRRRRLARPFAVHRH
jgi:hypothetical protein